MVTYAIYAKAGCEHTVPNVGKIRLLSKLYWIKYLRNKENNLDRIKDNVVILILNGNVYIYEL